jgi:4-hydroxy-tetrahydrodipicolinate synthase
MKRLTGVVVPTLTPLNVAGDALSLEGIAALADHLIVAGVSSLFLAGTTGESALLTESELVSLTAHTVEANRERVPIAVQVGANSTADTIHRAEAVLAAGADCIVAVTPFYFGHTDDELFDHYQAVANALAGVPVYLYSIPSRTGNSISPTLAARLAEVENIVGMKDSSGSLPQVLELLHTPLDVLIGNDLGGLLALRSGAVGMVSGPANVFPEPYVAMYKALQRHDSETALAMQDAIAVISHHVKHGAHMDILKGLANMRWGNMGSMRPPHHNLNQNALKRLAAHLHEDLRETVLPERAYDWLEA